MHGVQDFIGMKIGRDGTPMFNKVHQVNEAYPDKTDFWKDAMKGMIESASIIKTRN
jgi:hypothetical protein